MSKNYSTRDTLTSLAGNEVIPCWDGTQQAGGKNRRTSPSQVQSYINGTAATVSASRTHTGQFKTTHFEFTPTTYSANGAIDNANVSYAVIDAANNIALTLSEPAAGDVLVITKATATANQAHTVTIGANGTYDGANNVATFANQNDTLVLVGLAANRFGIVENIGAVALS